MRKLFQTDQKEGRDYRSPYRFEQEVDIISNRVQQIQQAWQEKEGDPGLVSRLRHYYLRVRRAETSDREAENIRKDLLRSISEALRSDTDKHSEDEVGRTDLGKKASLDHDEQNRKLGTIPKEKSPSSKPSNSGIAQPSYEELQSKVRELQEALQQLRMRGGRNEHQKSRNSELADPEQQGRSSIMERGDRRQNSNEAEDAERNYGKGCTSKQKDAKSWNYERRREDTTDESDDEAYGRRGYGWHGAYNRQDPPQQSERWGRVRPNEQRQNWRSPSDERFSTRGSFNSEDHRGRNYRQSRRIEHWKLSFSGDNRTTSVEIFLYKLKKIAQREEVSQRSLLRDIHLILEGQASDWFFTYVDEFEDWDDFEEKIRFRFGNPNQDQGIRQKIHERKQHRGESFSAFLSEIERLNKMLSRPLSRRRKFEVVWDNMRPHYRSKISIVRVRDLDHLIQLNHRIDAADSSFQPQPEARIGESRNHRNVHHVDCASSQDDSEGQEELAVVDTRSNQRGNRVSGRSLQTGPRDAGETNQQHANRTTGNLCWNCKKPGHNWRDCREPRAIFCYGCGELGRTIRSCQRCAESSHRRSGMKV